MNRFFAIFALFALLFVINACDSNSAIGTLTDSRDGQTYRIVKIGDQVWMAENLNFKIEGSRCNVDKPDSCKKYGRFYSWKAALKACPAGWHLPSNSDFGKLIAFVSGDSTVIAKFRSINGSWYSLEIGAKLKTKTGWNDCREGRGNGSDDFSFSILSVGPVIDWQEIFEDDGDYACFWTSTKNSAEAYPDYAYTNPDGSTFIESAEEISTSSTLNFNCQESYLSSAGRDFTYSVRCVKDALNEYANDSVVQKSARSLSVVVGAMTDSRDGQTYKTVKIGNQVWMAEKLRYKNEQLYSWPMAVGKSKGECGQKECNLGKGNVKGLCPDGWHLPSEVEFQTLIDSVGGETIAGRMLKSKSVWNGDDAYYWSSTERDYIYGTAVQLSKGSDSLSVVPRDKFYESAIRCIKD